jgi:hypothetical protein
MCMDSFGPNTHGALIQLPDGSNAFVDGIPDKCEHEWDGKGYHFVSFMDGGGFDALIAVADQTQEELEEMDKQLRFQGKYLSGGCVSCSKCGKPYSPEMF